MPGVGIGLGAALLGGRIGLTLRAGGAAASAFRREADGTVTILSLAAPWTPTLTRQPNGSVTVSE